MVNIAVIGAGYIGNVHLETLNRIAGLRVKALYDVNMELARKVASDHNVPVVADSVEEILADRQIEVVHVCTPNSLHFEQSLAALEAGKHVFSEKPLAVSSQQAGTLVKKARATGAITGIGFCYRYYPMVQEMALRIKRGDYGQVRMVTGSWFQDWLSEMRDYTWRLEKQQSGSSNVAADLGSHWFDLIGFVTGLEVSEVLADLYTLLPEREKPMKQALAFQKQDAQTAYEKVRIEVEDYASILFRLDSGRVPGSFTTSQVCPGRKSETEFQIYCSDASLAWNHKRSDELWIGHRHGANETLIENPLEMDERLAHYSTLPAGHPLGYRDAMTNMLKDYYEAVRVKDEGDGIARPTFLTGYKEMLLLDRIVASNSMRTWVEVSGDSKGVEG